MKAQLKIGIVGMGNAGMMHANSIIGGAISNAVLSVVCDRKERLEIACARGKIVMEDRQSRFHRTSVPIDEFNFHGGYDFLFAWHIIVIGISDIHGVCIKVIHILRHRLLLRNMKFSSTAHCLFQTLQAFLQ